jgi:hypothetical protein
MRLFCRSLAKNRSAEPLVFVPPDTLLAECRFVFVVTFGATILGRLTGGISADLLVVTKDGFEIREVVSRDAAL